LVHSVDILGLLSRPRRRWISQVPWRFHFCPCRALRPRRSLERPSPFTVAYCCLPGFRPCRPPDVSRGSIASLALRPGHRSVYA